MNKSKPSLSKLVIVGVVVLIAIFGIIGSFEFMKFNIDNYVKFLASFAPLFTPFTVVVGVGRGAKNYINARYNTTEEETTDTK